MTIHGHEFLKLMALVGIAGFGMSGLFVTLKKSSLCRQPET